MEIRILQLACVIGAVTLAYPVSQREPRPPHFEEFDAGKSDRLAVAEDEGVAVTKVVATIALKRADDTSEADDVSISSDIASDASSIRDLQYLADYAYSETPPPRKPAETVLETLKDVPVGTPIEEIKLASDAFGLDFNFMKTVAKIESDFDPKQRTGSYVGLFQLSNYEFGRYGSGDILDARDNAVAAAYKFKTAAILFELETHKKATLSDLYLIHQQGTQGAEEHVSHPDRIAWKSMCATEEGKEKGESWCKRAIWANTLPEIKRVWKSVDNLTSGAFVQMWQQRIEQFYTRYSDATPK
ncbi:MAG TPA: transglycosylase [Xanthobacteraceae bacterium]|nr:transglycosylase [Xanthobacteraceae bacterium]